MKKYRINIGGIIIAIMSTIMLVACSKNNEDIIDASEDERTEKVSKIWSVDLEYHWHETESGKRADKSKHRLVKDKCITCGAKVETDSIYSTVRVNDENGQIIIEKTYDSSTDELINDQKIDYTYDKNGYVTYEKIYSFGILSEERKTKVIYDGEEFVNCYLEETIMYNEDGTKLIEEYDEKGWAIKEILYKKNGTKKHEYVIKNEFNSMDLISDIKKYDGKKLVEELKIDYDNKGHETLKQKYENGKLVEEMYYKNENDVVYPVKKIEYSEDGKKRVVEYDKYGNEKEIE